MKKVKDVIFKDINNDGLWYHCPNCKTGFSFMDIIGNVSAEQISNERRIYKCKNCGAFFKMPE